MKIELYLFNTFLYSIWKYNFKPIKCPPLNSDKSIAKIKIRKSIVLKISSSNFRKTWLIYFLPCIWSSERASKFGRIVCRWWFNSWTRVHLNFSCFAGGRSIKDVIPFNYRLLLIKEFKLEWIIILIWFIWLGNGWIFLVFIGGSLTESRISIQSIGSNDVSIVIDANFLWLTTSHK